MTRSNTLLDLAVSLPWMPVVLGTLMGTTAMSTVLTWCINENLKSLLPERPSDEVLGDEEENLLAESDGSPEFVWHVSAATRTGQVRTENQDAFAVYDIGETCLLLTVFDGAGGVAGGKEASEAAAELCLEYVRSTEGLTVTPEARLLLIIEYIRDGFEKRGLEGITTAILAWVEEDRLTFATLGDGALTTVWPSGMVGQHLIPHHAFGEADNIITAYIGKRCEEPPRTGSIQLSEGTSVLLMSDGASDLFPYEQYAELHDAFAERLIAPTDQPLSESFLNAIETARDEETGAFLHHDNMTLIMAHITARSISEEPDHA